MGARIRQQGGKGNVIAARGELLPGQSGYGKAHCTIHFPGLFLLGFSLICAAAAAAGAQNAPQAAPQEPVQLAYPPKPAEETGPPAAITLADALQRAQKFNAEFLSALSDEKRSEEHTCELQSR